MPHNLQLYHKVLRQIRQWLPQERVTRQRNLAPLVAGLYLSMTIHLSQMASTWPLAGKELSLTNRLQRFLDNQRVTVDSWDVPLGRPLVDTFADKWLCLVVDCTKVGFNHRLLMIGLAYRKRTLPLAWSVHRGRKGHVATEAQIALFEQIRFLIPASAEGWVLGDTAFQHGLLLRWIRRRGWHFVIRQQGRIKVYHTHHGWRKINPFSLAEGQTRVIGWVRVT